MDTVCISDHGSLGAAPEFYKACKKESVKPIIGCEIYTAEDRTIKAKDQLGEEYYHLILLAQNDIGYKNLVKLVSLGNREGFYYKGRIDDKLLEQHSNGLLCSTACLGSRFAQLFKKASRAEAEKLILYYKDLFKDRFFIELQYHPTEPDQIELNKFLLEVSSKFDIPPIITCDAHYMEKKDGICKDSLHEQVLAIQTNKLLTDEKRFTFGGREHYIKSPQEVKEDLIRGSMPLDCISNTVHIGNLCDGLYPSLEAKVGMPEFPDVKVSPIHDLTMKAKWGLVNRFGSKDRVPKTYRDRLDYELSVIDKLEFASYFLIVEDYIREARSKNTMVGPGRGSGGASLVVWALGLTAKQLDPIELGLPFSRFLNESRVSPPDLDVDFEKGRRDEVFSYIESKYGKESCARLGTYGQFKPKSIVKDLARVQGKDQLEIRKLANLVPDDVRGKSPSMEEAIEQSSELLKYPEITNLATKLDRLVARQGVHASGLIIHNDDLSNYIPLTKSGEFESVTQFDMNEVEELGFVKFDILGLSNLDVIHKTLDLIEHTTGDKISIDDLPLDDPKAYDIICSGRLAGIFQLQDSLRSITTRVQPKSIYDLSFINSVGRPGPLGAGLLDLFLENRKRGSPPPDMPKVLHKILEETCWVYVYQEQLMQMAIELAGYTEIEADNLRKAIGKKLPEHMAKLKDSFINGCIKKEILTEQQTNELWEDIEGFSDYTFAKAHAMAYSLISYIEAWLKAHYPVQFMTALMSEEETLDRLSVYVSECRSMGITVTGPDINSSGVDFSIKGNEIIFGLKAIKGLSKGTAKHIPTTRGKIKFKSIEDFMCRIDRHKVNSARLRALVMAGAFDSLKYERSYLLSRVDEISGYYQKVDEHKDRLNKCEERDLLIEQKKAAGEPLGRLKPLKRPDSPTKPDIQTVEIPKVRLEDLNNEKEVLGCHVTLHPTDFITVNKETDRIGDICNEGQEGVINCTILSIKLIKDKKNNDMAFLLVEDQTAQADITVFSSLLKKATPISQGETIRVKYKTFSVTSTPIKLTATNIRRLRIE